MLDTSKTHNTPLMTVLNKAASRRYQSPMKKPALCGLVAFQRQAYIAFGWPGGAGESSTTGRFGGRGYFCSHLPLTIRQ